MPSFPLLATATIGALGCAVAVVATAATHSIGNRAPAEVTRTRTAIAAAASSDTPDSPSPSRTRQPRPVTGTPMFGDYRLPLAGKTELVAAFNPPATVYSAGHRGVDLAAGQGTAVLAAAAGVVRFAGEVAGRPVLVIQHPDGLSTEYEPVQPRVRVGQRVAAGQLIGVIHGAHQQCGADSCLHWGARRGETYIDPMSLLTQLGVVRLID